VVVQNVAQVNLLVVAFPLLFLVGAAVLAVRLLAPLLPAAARLAGRRSPAWYLAGRRVTASRAVSLILLAAASMPIAMSVYAAGLTRTSQYTLDAKANLLVGSAISVTTTDPLRRTADTDRVGTVVTRYLYGQVAGQDVAVLAIDPDTFAGTAFWDRRFADVPLATLLDRLRRPTADGRVPAVIAEGQLPTTFDVPLGKTTARLETVGTARLFPGRHLPRPIVVVSAARLGPVDPHAGTENELWSRGPLTAAEDAITRQHANVFDYRQRDTVFAAADFLGISWTFGYLTALAALVGLVAAGGLLLYLETRQRARIASYTLGRRMGLTRTTHLRSLLAELATLLALAYAIGTTLAAAAVLLIYRRLDVDLIRPPTPLLTIPTAAITGAAAAVAVVSVLASLYAQRAADRTNPATVLRLGG
jgi:putative ABC transport system permease protein